MNLDEMPDRLRPSEIAEYMRVSVDTVGRWIKAGRLEVIRTGGGHRRVTKASFEAMLSGPQPHKPYPHTGFGTACSVCSPAAGVPVAWPCGQ